MSQIALLENQVEDLSEKVTSLQRNNLKEQLVNAENGFKASLEALKVENEIIESVSQTLFRERQNIMDDVKREAP